LGSISPKFYEQLLYKKIPKLQKKHWRLACFLCFLGSGVNFTNSLRAAFTLVDFESVKKIDNLTVFFMLLGSAPSKAAHKMLMKLTPICVKASSKHIGEIDHSFGRTFVENFC